MKRVLGRGAWSQRREDVVVFTSLSRECWGAEHSLLGIATALYRQGHAVSLVAPQGALVDAWQEARIGDSFSLEAGDSGRLHLSVALVDTVRRLPVGCTVVLFSLELLPVFTLLRIVGLLRHRLVLDVHNFLPSASGRAKLKWFSRFVDRTICVSDFVSSQVSRRVPYAVIARPIEGPIGESVNSGSDVTTPWNAVHPRPFKVGIVGRVDPEKGVLEGIEVVHRVVSACAVVLYIRGAASGPGGDLFAERVRSTGADLLGERFVFEGRVAHALALADLDLLLFMSPHEPSGRTIAEAQMRGIPALCLASGGAQEFVEPGVSGWRASSHLEMSDLLRDIVTGRLAMPTRSDVQNWACGRYENSARAADYWNAMMC